jgi:NDP-sugar pyrophosphorylase family protein
MANSELKSARDDIRRIVDDKTDRFLTEMYGIISAGGRGVRLRPRTLELPKPLLDIGLHKKPLLYWSMLPMILGGVSHFFVGVRYGADKIEQRFGRGKELSKEFGRTITIDYIEEPEPLGRAGFVKYGLERGLINPDRPAIMFNASDILKINLRELVRHYLWVNANHECEALQVYTSGFRVRYGLGKVDPSTLSVTEFEEKPLRSDLASTACYVIYGRLNDFREVKTPSNPEDQLVPRWIKEKIVAAYIIPFENIVSIKFEEDLVRANEMNLERYVKSIYR